MPTQRAFHQETEERRDAEDQAEQDGDLVEPQRFQFLHQFGGAQKQDDVHDEEKDETHSLRAQVDGRAGATIEE